LAASRLERENATPAARELAAGIGEAVSDLDSMITQLLTVLVPPTRLEVARERLNAVIPALHKRLGPVLAARGVRWDLPKTESQIFGDADAVRAAALVVLRAGADFAGRGGWLRLEIQKDEERYGLRLECGAAEEAPTSGCTEASLQALRSRIYAQGGAIDAECSGVDCAADVWLSGGAWCE
jgi:hypothetical protein